MFESPNVLSGHSLAFGSSPMPSEWKRWFDALKAAGVDRLGDQAAGEARGMFPATGATRSWGENPMKGLRQAYRANPDWTTKGMQPTQATLRPLHQRYFYGEPR